MEAPPVSKNFAALLRNHKAGPERKPIVALEGSSRSSKTWSILEYLVICCLDTPGLVVTCFRHDGTTHTKSTWRDLKEILAKKFPVTNAQVRFDKQEKTCRFENGSVFEFAATNDIEKLHGPQRDIAWLNEVMEIGYEAWVQIQNRTAIFSILDWNPSLAHHWVFDKVLTGPDALHVHSTYKDNPHLSAQQVANIEKLNPDVPENVARGTADKWSWEVYGLGKRGRREGVIYTNWTVEDAWPERYACQRWGYGVDFGFGGDPSAVVECCLYNGDIWLREIAYETKLVVRPSESMPNVPTLCGRMNAVGCDKRARTWCDEGRPDSIKDMQLSGYSNAAGVPKGPGSVLAGITLVSGFFLRVHRSAQNIQRELEQYAWKKNRATGELEGEPDDANNHAMDALRYWAMAELRGRPAGVYTSDGPRGPVEAETCLVRY